MTRKSSFLPVVAADTRLLVLGSLPGDRSLAEGRYYAHPRNRFWHLMSGVVGLPLERLAYDERLAALLEAKVGLWDSVASAIRQGSLDGAIRGAEVNALTGLVSSLPELVAVAFNGRASAEIGMPQLSASGLTLLPLPSSSPAYAVMPLAEKERHWLALRKFLQ
jgi:double-stranded uracil-DNA glycosylase